MERRRTKDDVNPNTEEAREFTLVNSETIPLTRELAKEMAEMPGTPTERPLDPKRLAFLRDRAEAHMLLPFQWAKAKMNGDVWRLNGQHSSRMLTELPDELFPDGITVHMDLYEVPETDTLARLFQQFDPRQSARYSSEIANAYRSLVPALVDVKTEVAKRGIEGIIYWEKVQGLPSNPKNRTDERYERMTNPAVWDVLVWMNDVYTMKTPELRKKEIAAAMYATFEANETAAREFWNFVACGGDVTQENHPTATLDQFFQYYRGEMEKKEKKKYSNHSLYQNSILAWNAFREGKPLVKAKARMNRDPEVLT